MATKKQLAKHEHVLGSSDISALFDCHPNDQTAHGLWLRLTGKLETKEWKPAPHLSIGLDMEPMLLRFAETQLAEKVTRRGTERRIDGLPVVCHIDGMTVDTKKPVEAKTHRVFYYSKYDYGDPSIPNSVPPHVIFQTHAHMMSVGDSADVCWVPVFYGGRGPLLYRVNRDNELCGMIADRVVEFWEYVESDREPGGMVPLDVATTIRKIAGTRVILPDTARTLVNAYVEAGDRATRAKRAKDEALAGILTMMGDAEIGEIPGVGEFTYKSFVRKGYTVAETTGRRANWKPFKIPEGGDDNADR